ncbi:MAG: hypothetical protein LBJ93_00345 [Clostridiales bacterium]|jgi:hypothetical protein|nr:hypothetical protein [Clostridiales bacterium]
MIEVLKKIQKLHPFFGYLKLTKDGPYEYELRLFYVNWTSSSFSKPGVPKIDTSLCNNFNYLSSTLKYNSEKERLFLWGYIVSYCILLSIKENT